MQRPPAAAPPAAQGTWLVDGSATTTGPFASRGEPGAGDRADYVENAAPTTSSIGTDNGVLHRLQMPTLDCLAAAFRAFLRPFAGPAAKYLEAYAAWFIKRLEGNDEGRLEHAWNLLMA